MCGLSPMHAQLEEAYDQRFPYHPRQTWRHADSEGELYGWPSDVSVSVVEFQGAQYVVHTCFVAYPAEADMLLRKRRLYHNMTGQKAKAVLITLESTEEGLRVCQDQAEMCAAR